jgi:hypothetical protein
MDAPAERELKVGIRIDLPPAGKGLRFFGHDEVNALIGEGWRVTAIQPGDAVLTKTGEGGGTVSMVLAGCDLKIILTPPPASGSSSE